MNVSVYQHILQYIWGSSICHILYIYLLHMYGLQDAHNKYLCSSYHISDKCHMCTLDTGSQVKKPQKRQQKFYLQGKKIHVMKRLVRILWAYTLIVTSLDSSNVCCQTAYLWLSQQMTTKKGKKKKERITLMALHYLTFARRIVSGIVLLLQCVVSSARWNPCQPCHLIPVQPQNPSELYEHKAVMNLSPSVILSWAAGSPHSQSSALTGSCAQPGFFFSRLIQKKKKT